MKQLNQWQTGVAEIETWARSKRMRKLVTNVCMHFKVEKIHIHNEIKIKKRSNYINLHGP